MNFKWQNKFFELSPIWDTPSPTRNRSTHVYNETSYFRYSNDRLTYLDGFLISSVTRVTLTQPSYAHNPLKKANAIFPGLVMVPSKPVLKFFVFPLHSSYTPPAITITHATTFPMLQKLLIVTNNLTLRKLIYVTMTGEKKDMFKRGTFFEFQNKVLLENCLTKHCYCQ